MIAVNKEQEPIDTKQFKHELLPLDLVQTYWKECAYDGLYGHYMSVLESQLQDLEPDHHELINTYQQLALVCVRKGDYEQGVEYNWKACRISLKEKVRHDYQLAESYELLGNAHTEKKEYDKGLKCLGMALRIFRDLNAKDKVAHSYNNIGETLRRKGDLANAVSYLETAIKMSLQLFGKQDFMTGISFGNLGKLLVQKGEFEKALPNLYKARRILTKVLGPKHSFTKKSHRWIARAKRREAKSASADLDL